MLAIKTILKQAVSVIEEAVKVIITRGAVREKQA